MRSNDFQYNDESGQELPPKFQVWVDARRLFHLSHVHIQMARELGMNPKKFGSLANHDQERWKTPLTGFIEDLFFKRFGKERPDENATNFTATTSPSRSRPRP